MQANLGIMASALVPASADAPERERLAAFLSDKLSLAVAVLAVAPLFLAARGAPTPAESLFFAALLVPGAAALVVARTGRLAYGHAFAAAGLAAIGLTSFRGLGADAGVAIAWLGAAALEAASLGRRARRYAGFALGGLVAALVVAAFDPRFAPSLPPGANAVLATAAAAVAALSLWRLCGTQSRLEAAAEASDARATAIEALQGRVVCDLDADGVLRALRQPAAGLLGEEDEALLGRGLLDRVHVADRPAFLKLINDAAHGTQVAVGRFRFRIEAGKGSTCHLELEMRASRLPPASLSPNAVVAVLEDVSDRSAQAHELETSRGAVAEALRAKDQFMTTMSHELRSPLNAIIGFSDMLASRTTRPEDVAKQLEFARIIHQSGQHLLELVNAVLDVSRLQSGTYAIRPEAFDPASLLAHAVETVAGKASLGAIRLHRDLPPALEEIIGDERALTAALAALLTNAVKFTPPGGEVALAARPEGTTLVVTVDDTGSGIAAQDLARLGQPFFQAGGSLTRSFDGAGLGLALVRGIVGLHGGRLTVESELALGTKVTLHLPLDCRVIANRTAELEIETTRRLRRLPTLVKDAA